jgi:hypothetical protein
MTKETEINFLIPFDEASEGGWRLFFPFRKVHHMGIIKDFTQEDGEQMVANFKAPVPDYPLPVNERHDDSVGIYGFIDDLRVGDGGVEWRPKFFEGKEDVLKQKGFLYASPEVIFDGYTGVYDGEVYKNVALGVAITPRPRLGRSTLVFSDGEWSEYEQETVDMEGEMVETAFNEEQVEEVKKEVEHNILTFFRDLFASSKDEPETTVEEEGEDVPAVNLDEKLDTLRQEFSEKLEEKDAEITRLGEALQEKETALTAIDEEKQRAVTEKRLMEFTETASEIAGLPVEASEFADVLMWLSDTDETEGQLYFNQIVDTLKALGNREKMAALFGEVGHEGATPKSAEDRYERMVKEKMDKGASRAEAIQAVFGENPDLYREYNDETVKKIRPSKE